MTKTVDIEGIGSVYAEKLIKAGVRSVESLLKQGATPRGREEIAESTGISKTLVLEWVNHADLYRIKGIAEEYSDLLEEAGVDTVVELAQRRADHLHAKMLEVNHVKKLVRRPPSLSEVERWVEHAKTLPRAVHY